MALKDLEAYAQRLIDEQWQPPRQFDWRVVTHVLQDRQPMFLALFGIFGLCTTVALVLRLRLNSWSMTSWGEGLALLPIIITGGMGLLCLWAPLLLTWRWYVGLRYGVLAEAVVKEIEELQSTFRGIEHGGGTVRGQWIVYLPNRTFQELFYVDEPWVRSVRVGARIRVLAHPWRRKVLVQLGP